MNFVARNRTCCGCQENRDQVPLALSVLWSVLVNT